MLLKNTNLNIYTNSRCGCCAKLKNIFIQILSLNIVIDDNFNGHHPDFVLWS